MKGPFCRRKDTADQHGKADHADRAVTVVKYNAKDPAAGLCLVRNAAVPETPPGHVLVNVQWRPINPSDIMWCARGLPVLSC